MIAEALFRSSVSAYGWAHHVTRVLHELDRFCRPQPDPITSTLVFRLRSTLKYFGSRLGGVPEWESVGAIDTQDEFIRCWQRLPILTKDTLNRDFPPDKLRAAGLHGVLSSTGGSTGQPTRFLLDRAVLNVNAAKTLYARRQIGWRPEMTTIAVWGSDVDVGGHGSVLAHIKHRLCNTRVIGGYKLDDRTVSRFLSTVSRCRIAAVYGFTSMLEFLARGVLERGVTLSQIRVCWNGGEMLLPDQAKLISAAFGAPVWNFYGCREVSLIAFQNRSHDVLTVLRPYLMVEIVDDDGNPVQPGVPGRILITNTACRATPFIRYDVGDIATYSEKHRDVCGVSAIQELIGRRAGTVKLGDGLVLSALYWNHLFKDYQEVRQFQVILGDESAITLRLVGTGMNLARETSLRTVICRCLGNRQLALKWVNDIPRTRAGKLIQVISESHRVEP